MPSAPSGHTHANMCISSYTCTCPRLQVHLHQKRVSVIDSALLSSMGGQIVVYGVLWSGKGYQVDNSVEWIDLAMLCWVHPAGSHTKKQEGVCDPISCDLHSKHFFSQGVFGTPQSSSSSSSSKHVQQFQDMVCVLYLGKWKTSSSCYWPLLACAFCSASHQHSGLWMVTGVSPMCLLGLSSGCLW